MVAEPARLPVTTPFRSTVTYLVFEEEKDRVPTTSSGSSWTFNWSFSPTPMVVRGALRATLLGASL